MPSPICPWELLPHALTAPSLVTAIAWLPRVAMPMTFDNVVSSRVYITDGTKFQEMNKVYTTYFTKEPPARATVIAPLMGPQYQIEITLTASSLPKQVFTTPAADGTPGKPSPILSSAVKVGNRLYVSGLLGNTKETLGNPEAQTKEIMARVERTLKAAGFGWNDVVDGIVYITDVKNFDAMNAGYRSVPHHHGEAETAIEPGDLLIVFDSARAACS